MLKRIVALSVAAIVVFGLDLYFAMKRGKEFIADVKKDIDALPTAKK
jgi:hypothetical protein